MNTSLDRVFIRNLLTQGILGVNPDERVNKQNILVNVTMWVDTRPAADSDDIADAVNYATVANSLSAHIQQSEPLLVERLASDLVELCFAANSRIEAVELTVEKPDAVENTQAVGVTIYRERHND